MKIVTTGVWIICIKEHYLNNYLMAVGNDGYCSGEDIEEVKKNIDRRYWREATEEEIIVIKERIKKENEK